MRQAKRGAPSYRTLRRYGLTVEEARAALGVGEVWEPAVRAPVSEPEPEPVLGPMPGLSVVIADDVGVVPRREHVPWTSICDRVPDPLAPLRRGAGVLVR